MRLDMYCLIYFIGYASYVIAYQMSALAKSGGITKPWFFADGIALAVFLTFLGFEIFMKLAEGIQEKLKGNNNGPNEYETYAQTSFE